MIAGRDPFKAERTDTPPVAERQRRPTSRRLYIAVALVYGLIVFGVARSVLRAWDRWDSQRVLAAAHQGELEAAVADGVVLRLEGGGWVAVRYTPGRMIWSRPYAVIRTSDGRWLGHEHRYGEEFREFAADRARLDQASAGVSAATVDTLRAALRGMGDSQTGARLWLVERSTTLDEAVTKLEHMGFRRL